MKPAKCDWPDFTLDPEDWEDLRRLGHRIIDDLVDDWRGIRERPVWQSVPEAVKLRFRDPLPSTGQGAEAAYRDFLHDVRPYPRGNCHPRFWGWVNGSGLPVGVLADLLASAMNSSVAAFENSATMVEEQVLEWLKQMLNLPTAASGVLTSGCSMSNLIGLAVARDAKLGNARAGGLVEAKSRPILYASDQSHSSIQKAVELLGFGSASLRPVPVDDEFRMDPAALLRMIATDRAAGNTPVCVIGNAGTVNTGAVDPLARLADVCRAENLWFHIDGAFGALGWLSASARPLLAGMQWADSLAFDLHKWMYLPYDVGCVMVRDRSAHEAALSLSGPYWAANPGSGAYLTNFSDRGIEVTRRFRALKVWLALKTHGLDAFSRMIETNIEQAAYVRNCLATREDFETLPGSLNVACFRFRRAGLDLDAINRLNETLLARLQMSGIAFPTHTRIDGRFMIRLAITNHRTTRGDLDVFLEEMLRMAHALYLERPPLPA
jgi:aromatic-L-amino-acid decarboxylase